MNFFYLCLAYLLGFILFAAAPSEFIQLTYKLKKLLPNSLNAKREPYFKKLLLLRSLSNTKLVNATANNSLFTKHNETLKLLSFLIRYIDKKFPSQLRKIYLNDERPSNFFEVISSDFSSEQVRYYFAIYNEFISTLYKLSEQFFESRLTILICYSSYKSFTYQLLKDQNACHSHAKDILRQVEDILRKIKSNFSPSDIVFKKIPQINSYQSKLNSIIKKEISETTIVKLQKINIGIQKFNKILDLAIPSSQIFEKNLKKLDHSIEKLRYFTHERQNTYSAPKFTKIVYDTRSKAIINKRHGNYYQGNEELGISLLLVELIIVYVDTAQDIYELTNILNYLDSLKRNFAINLKNEFVKFEISVYKNRVFQENFVNKETNHLQAIKFKALEIITTHKRTLAELSESFENSYFALQRIGERLATLHQLSILNQEPLQMEYVNLSDKYKNTDYYLKTSPHKIVKWIEEVNSLDSETSTEVTTVHKLIDDTKLSLEEFMKKTTLLSEKNNYGMEFAKKIIDQENKLIEESYAKIERAKSIKEFEINQKEFINVLQTTSNNLRPLYIQIDECNQIYDDIKRLLHNLERADVSGKHQKETYLHITSIRKNHVNVTLKCKQYEETRDKLKEIYSSVENLTTVYLKGGLSMNTYQNSGVVGAMGDDAKVDNSTFNQLKLEGSNIDVNSVALAEELNKLKEHLKQIAEKPEHFDDLSAIASAEEAIQENNPSKVKDNLKKASKWVLDTATSIGVRVAAEAIKQSYL